MIDETRPTDTTAGRRRLLAALAAATGAAATGVVLPRSWKKAVVDAVEVPVHAQTSGAQTSSSFGAIGTPAAIPDLGSMSVNFNVTGLSGPIVKVTLALSITHTFLADLDVVLTSPAVANSELFSDICGSNDNMNTTLDDDAPTAIGTTCPPLSGTFTTESGSGLSAFIGTAPNGTWTLSIADDAGLDVGALNSATLSITTLA